MHDHWTPVLYNAPDSSASSAGPLSDVRSSASVVVAGHICLDIIPALPPVVPGVAWLQPGSLVHAGPASFATGGAVANTGLALHRFGIPTRLVARTGEDLFGAALRSLLEQVDPGLVEHLRVESRAATSYTFVLSPAGWDRTFLYHSGANAYFDSADITAALLNDAQLFHLGYPPLLPHLCEEDGLELATLFQRVQAAGLATSLDMAYIDPSSDAGHIDWRTLLARTLPAVDLFSPNLTETIAILDPDNARTAGSERSGPGQQLDLAYLSQLSATILEMGAAIIMIKLGVQGLYLRTTADPARLQRVGQLPLSSAWLNCERYIPAFEVTEVGATGAGDCATAALIAAMLRGAVPVDALTMAAAAGAASVEQADATGALPPWAELDARVRSGWRRRPWAL
jgi:sugar/nucleoside kinase (ribokinase family)